MGNNLSRMRNLKLGAIFITIFFSISSSSTLVLLSEATAVSCAFWRVLIASLILWFVRFLSRGSKSLIIDKEVLSYSVVSGIFLAIHFLLWIESLFIIPVAVSTTIVVTYPLFAVLVDLFVFKEDIVFFQVIGLIIGLFGVLLFLHPWVLSDYNHYGIYLSLGGALSATGYFSIGRFLRKKTDLLSYTTLAYTSSSITILLYALMRNENLLNYPPKTFTFFVLLAIVPMIGGHTLINYILRFMKASIATSIALCEPIGATILAYFILKQQITKPTIIIMVIVITAIVLTISKEKAI